MHTILCRGGRGVHNAPRHARLEHTEEQEGLHEGVFRGQGEGERLKIVWAEEDGWIPVERGERLAEMTGAVLNLEHAGSSSGWLHARPKA